MTPTAADIRALADRIAADFRPYKIILFGSQAKGGVHTDSDIDLLVVMPIHEPRSRLAGRIRASLTGDWPIDVVVRSPAEIAGELGRLDPLVADAAESGIVLYNAAA